MLAVRDAIELPCLVSFCSRSLDRSHIVGNLAHYSSTSPCRPLLSLYHALSHVSTLGRLLPFVFSQSCIGFTKKQDNQIKQTCYAQASQIRAVRKKMCDIMSEEASKCDLRELVLKL